MEPSDKGAAELLSGKPILSFIFIGLIITFVSGHFSSNNGISAFLFVTLNFILLPIITFICLVANLYLLFFKKNSVNFINFALSVLLSAIVTYLCIYDIGLSIIQ